jgi:hypothetical protein
VEFAHWFGLPDPVPVIAVTLEDPWFDQNVGDILYHMLKRGKPTVDKWMKGMGSVEEVELEAEQRPQRCAIQRYYSYKGIIDKGIIHTKVLLNKGIVRN